MMMMHAHISKCWAFPTHVSLFEIHEIVLSSYMPFRHLGLSMYHAKIFILSALVSILIRVQNDIDLNNNSGVQRFSHLDICIVYQYLVGITILIPTSRFFDDIVDVDYLYHAFAYISYQHKKLPHTHDIRTSLIAHWVTPKCLRGPYQASPNKK